MLRDQRVITRYEDLYLGTICSDAARIPCVPTQITDNPNKGIHEGLNISGVYTSRSRALPEGTFVYTQLSSLQIPLSGSRHPRVRKITLS